MKVFDLHCDSGHLFEGWFASHEDYQTQRERGFLQCPVCGSTHIERAPSAPYVKSKSNRAADRQREVSHQTQAEDQARWLKQAREMLKQAEDVGQRFAQEARRIHEGQAPERPIHGQANVHEVVELLEEGVPVLPLPAALSEPLQ